MNLRLYLCAIAVALSLDVEAAWAQLSGHGGPVRALAISADGKSVISGSFDTSAIRWSLATDSAEQVLRFHSDAVNAVVFLQDGPPDVITLTSPLNAVAIAPDGEIATGGADGRVRFLTVEAKETGEVQAGPTPIVALAMSRDGALIAAAGIGGAVALIDRKERRVLRTLGGPGLPVWSVAFLPDNATVLTGGADGAIRRWNALTGDPIESSLTGTPADPLAA